MEINGKVLIKKSNHRLISYANTHELLHYERPYFYNFPPSKRSINAQRNPSAERRADNLYRARRHIEILINANAYQYGCAPRFYTFTFSRNISDVREANEAWIRFNREFRHVFGRKKYLGVIEFQKRGAVHYHVLYFDLKYSRGIKSRIEKLWGEGFVFAKSVKRLQSISNVGLYISKYLQKETIDGRLRRKKAYFTSRGLLKPVVMREFIHISDVLARKELVVESKSQYTSKMYGDITIKKITTC